MRVKKKILRESKNEREKEKIQKSLLKFQKEAFLSFQSFS